MKPIQKLISVFFVFVFCLVIIFNTNIFAETTTPIIDLTGLVTGEDAQHSCIFISQHNNTNHWQECIICKKTKDNAMHNLSTTGSNMCGSYLVTSCNGCGYNYSEEVQHQIHFYTPEELAQLGYQTNTQTYYHHVGKCTICNSQEINFGIDIGCKDANGKKIDCSNRGICATCGYDYSKLTTISHHTTHTKDGKTYFCGFCGVETHTQLWKNATQDSTNNYHWYLKGIYKLGDGMGWKYTSGLVTWSPMLASKTVSLTTATVQDLPAEYYNKKEYGTLGITSGLYLVSYEATISTGFQGTCYVRMNSDSVITNVNGNSNEYAKTYTVDFDISPDTVAPSNLLAISYGNGTTTNYSQVAYIEASCTDNYSDTISMSLYDKNNNCIIPDTAAIKQGDKFVVKFDFSQADIEINEPTDFIVKYKDRFGNEANTTVSLAYIDTKAPTLNSSKSYTSEWTKTKEISFEAVGNGVENNGQDNVFIGFNNQNDLVFANFISNKFTRDYIFIGDVYDYVTASIYLEDSLGNIRTEFVNIGRLDNTPPTITNVERQRNNNKIEFIISSNDINTILNQEGSGVNGYAITNDTTEPSDELFQSSNILSVSNNGRYYVWIKDVVGHKVMYPIQLSVDELELDIRVTNIWNDQDNNYDTRPDSLNIFILQNSKQINTLSLSSGNAIDNNTWQSSSITVPKYDENGKEYTYTIQEDENNLNLLYYYDPDKITYDQNTLTVTNYGVWMVLGANDIPDNYKHTITIHKDIVGTTEAFDRLSLSPDDTYIFPIVLKQMNLTYSKGETSMLENYEGFSGNIYTGYVTNKNDLIFADIPAGKYEVSEETVQYFDFNSFSLSLASQGASFTEEDGKYYITISSLTKANEAITINSQSILDDLRFSTASNTKNNLFKLP